MHIRKLVKSGAASHTLSLPKDWLEKNKLKKGSLLYLKEKNNKLIISSEFKEEQPSQKEITISIDKKDIGTIRRETISAYINNYTIFRFLGPTINVKLEDIKGILDNFLALEIIEHTPKSLVAKDFLNLKEFSLKTTLRRMDMMARSMMQDSRKGNQEYAALCLKDFEVDKLFFLISRLIRAKLSDSSSNLRVRALSIWWLAKNLESIADSAKQLSQEFSPKIEQLYAEIENYYKECIKSYFTQDKTLADSLISKRGSLLEKCDNLKQKEQLKSMLNSSRNIAKIVLDS